MALRTNRPLVLRMETNGQFTILTDDIELAGTLIQSLAAYLNLSDLQVNCDYPEELENLQETVVKVLEFLNFFSKERVFGLKMTNRT
jgi:Bardet-Biedl syndrome 2 protein